MRAAASAEEAITLTVAGMIAGTASYMAPEQARGEAADHRADIFSFGAVAYEMLAGVRAFDRDSAVETLHAVLNDDPPAFAAERKVPAPLESIVRHCLEKGQRERFQSAWDLAFALEAISGGSPVTRMPVAAAPPRPLRRTTWAVAVASFTAGVLLAWLTLARFAASPQSHPGINNATFAQLTDDAGPELFPSLSPDGKSFVYASRVAGNWNIYAQPVGGRGVVNLTSDSPQDDTQPAHSPDGRHIAFRSERDGGGIFVMNADGSSVRRLADSGYNPAWSPDGRQIVFAEEGITRPEDRQTAVSRLWSVDLATGHKRAIGSGDGVQPRWSPHGHRIAYWAIDKSGHRDIWTIPAGGGTPVPVTRDEFIDWSPAWSPEGQHLYFCSNRGTRMQIWRVPIQETSGKPLGPPELVSTPFRYNGHLSFSRDGRHLAYVEQGISSAVHRVTFDPGSEIVIDEPSLVVQASRQASRPALAPDGEWLAFSSAGSQEDIYVVRADGTGLRQLTNQGHQDRGPRWSPDSRQIAFFSKRSGNWEIWTIDREGGGLRQITSLAGPNVAWPVWSPKGNRLVYTIFGFNSFLMDPMRPWDK